MKNLLRDAGGRFMTKVGGIKNHRKTIIFLGIIWAMSFYSALSYGVHTIDSVIQEYNPLKSLSIVRANTQIYTAPEPQGYGLNPTNKNLQAYIQQETEREMKNPKNLEEYRKQVEEMVINNINILTKTAY
jgi:hypothetical protein